MKKGEKRRNEKSDVTRTRGAKVSQDALSLYISRIPGSRIDEKGSDLAQ